MAIIENVTFRLAAGADEADFLAADRAVQEDLVPNRPGFLRRTTARGADGEWLVVTLWRSEQDAEATLQEIHDDPVHLRFMALVDQPSLTTRRYTTLD